jgi:hypothetical protein
VATWKKQAQRKGSTGKGLIQSIERFIEAARRRGVNESLEDFAVKFQKTVAAEKKARLS